MDFLDFSVKSASHGDEKSSWWKRKQKRQVMVRRKPKRQVMVMEKAEESAHGGKESKLKSGRSWWRRKQKRQVMVVQKAEEVGHSGRKSRRGRS
jgi:hypothetical protein